MQSVSDPAAGRYRAIWRWHFYAGLFVAPFLLVLAVTGSIYLFREDINDIIYPQLRFVQSQGEPLPLSRVIAAAESAHPGGRAARVSMPEEAGRSVEVFIQKEGGHGGGFNGPPLRVFVDPVSGQVLGQYNYNRTLVGLAKAVHGSLLMGGVGKCMMELAACWALVLVITGLYLWWPRGGRKGGVFVPRLHAQGRRFWKDLHAVTGFWTGAVIVFLVLTGLPWTEIWGDTLRDASKAMNLSYPQQLFARVPASQSSALQQDGAPWTMQEAPIPQSHDHHGDGSGALSAGGIGIDRALEIAKAQGVTGGFDLIMPRGERGVYTVRITPDRPEGQRTLHIDQYSGAVLADIGFAQYGAVAKAVEMGVALHTGTYFGRANQAAMLFGCFGIIGLTVTGVTMWWIRRPRAGMGAPEHLPGAPLRSLQVLLASLGVLFPLVGVSLLAALLADWLLARFIRPPVAAAP